MTLTADSNHLAKLDLPKSLVKVFRQALFALHRYIDFCLLEKKLEITLVGLVFLFFLLILP